MAGKRLPRLPRPQGIALWAPITGLLALGFVTTLIDLNSLSDKESARANAARQRFVVNTVTGEVMLGVASVGGGAEKFDVGTPEETKPPEPRPALDGASDVAPTTSEHPAEAPKPEPEPVAEVSPLPEGAPTLRTAPMLMAVEENPTRTKDSLVIAPAREVMETVDGLQLPKRGDKDVIPSQLYSHPFERKPEQVIISFVVMDAGIDPQSIGLLMALPMEVTVAYSPYTRPGQSYSETLRAGGHEVWTMLPTMDSGYPANDPGPLGIIGTMPPEEMVRRTQHVLAAIPGSVGLILPPTETIVPQKGGIAPVIGELSKRGLLLLSTHPSRNIDQISNKADDAVMIRRADLVIDGSPNDSQIRSKLAGLLEAAQAKGEYVVMLSARPQSLQILRDWLKETTLPENVVLAPLSAIYKPKDKPTAQEEEPKDAGHGGEKKEKPKPPAKQKPKVLPQDQYLKPADDKKEGGGH
ncbi:MAG: divergent polysaccharide deacetylase family protein [Rickettsiales bacterium]